MNQKIKEIAERVKELRGLCDYTVLDVAYKLGIAEDTYLAYESGEKDFPASVLCEVAKILGVDSSVLLTGEEARMRVFAVTRRDKGVSVERRKQYSYQNLAANFIHKEFEPFVVTVEPKDEAAEVTTATHEGQEFNYVIEGKLKVYIHKNEIVLDEGDSIFFDSSYPHAMRALDGKKAKFLAIVK